MFHFACCSIANTSTQTKLNSDFKRNDCQMRTQKKKTKMKNSAVSLLYIFDLMDIFRFDVENNFCLICVIQRIL